MPDDTITLRLDREIAQSVLRKLEREALGYGEDGYRAGQFVNQLRAALESAEPTQPVRYGHGH